MSAPSAQGLGSTAIKEDYVCEMVRFGASELHNVASIIGGVGAQVGIPMRLLFFFYTLLFFSFRIFSFEGRRQPRLRNEFVLVLLGSSAMRASAMRNLTVGVCASACVLCRR